MNLIRYQTRSVLPWQNFDRCGLREELNDLFELPSRANFSRQAQLFAAWTPALDLYQSADNVVAVVELPGMRKEDIQISLHDGTLTISGERESASGDGEASERSERVSGKFRRSVTMPTRNRRGESERQLQGWSFDCHAAESRGRKKSKSTSTEHLEESKV